ncbi:MAG: putative heme protein [Candidatus Scalindua brodae]|uniref:Putative heme protein n=1 Tax=Candidatus Scalindua brodae TaxID=237368 RepID=A0A0B0EP63_9BACT|nr:MAG: putative heme protein [Candidatus Scalindua brodae]
MRDDVVAQKIVDKCLICHDAGRIFLERKSKRDWFTHHEFKIIVDLLVKTQGLESETSVTRKKKQKTRVKKTVSSKRKILQNKLLDFK